VGRGICAVEYSLGGEESVLVRGDDVLEKRDGADGLGVVAVDVGEVLEGCEAVGIGEVHWAGHELE
jgi:hypothetical protein